MHRNYRCFWLVIYKILSFLKIQIYDNQIYDKRNKNAYQISIDKFNYCYLQIICDG